MSEKKEYAKITFRLTAEERQNVEEYCGKFDIKMSQLLRLAVKEYMNNHPDGWLN